VLHSGHGQIHRGTTRPCTARAHVWHAYERNPRAHHGGTLDMSKFHTNQLAGFPEISGGWQMQ